MIKKLLLTTQMIWMIFINTIDKTQKILIVFDDMIADMLINKTLYQIVTESFIRGEKLNIFLVFITYILNLNITLHYHTNIKLNSNYFLMKIPNKSELHQITFSNLSDINFQDFMNLYK